MDWDINEEMHDTYLKVRLTNGAKGEGLSIYLYNNGRVRIDMGTNADFSIRRGNGMTERNPV